MYILPQKNSKKGKPVELVSTVFVCVCEVKMIILHKRFPIYKFIWA